MLTTLKSVVLSVLDLGQVLVDCTDKHEEGITLLCLPCDTDKYNYRKGITLILIMVVSLASYVKLNTVIVAVAMKDLDTGVNIVQGLLVVALLSIGLNLFFAKQYGFHCEQIKNHQDLVQELSHQRDFDMLSGIKNRNAFIRFAQQIDRQNTGLSVIVCDIDGLKIINDTLGHMAGDTIVRKAAEILNASLTSNAQLFRMGGDEFIIVFTQFLPEEELRKSKSVIKEKLADYNNCHPSVPLSMSIGFAAALKENSRFGDVVKQADYAMYQEKRTCQEKVYLSLRAALVE